MLESMAPVHVLKVPAGHSLHAKVRNASLQVPAGLQSGSRKAVAGTPQRVSGTKTSTSTRTSTSGVNSCQHHQPGTAFHSPAGAGVSSGTVAELAGEALAGGGVTGRLGALHHRPCPRLLPEDEVECEGNVNFPAACRVVVVWRRRVTMQGVPACVHCRQQQLGMHKPMLQRLASKAASMSCELWGSAPPMRSAQPFSPNCQAQKSWHCRQGRGVVENRGVLGHHPGETRLRTLLLAHTARRIQAQALPPVAIWHVRAARTASQQPAVCELQTDGVCMHQLVFAPGRPPSCASARHPGTAPAGRSCTCTTMPVERAAGVSLAEEARGRATDAFQLQQLRGGRRQWSRPANARPPSPSSPDFS